jgi:hypothetical protein
MRIEQITKRDSWSIRESLDCIEGFVVEKVRLWKEVELRDDVTKVLCGLRLR